MGDHEQGRGQSHSLTEVCELALLAMDGRRRLDILVSSGCNSISALATAVSVQETRNKGIVQHATPVDQLLHFHPGSPCPSHLHQTWMAPHCPLKPPRSSERTASSVLSRGNVHGQKALSACFILRQRIPVPRSPSQRSHLPCRARASPRHSAAACLGRASWSAAWAPHTFGQTGLPNQLE